MKELEVEGHDLDTGVTSDSPVRVALRVTYPTIRMRGSCSHGICIRTKEVLSNSWLYMCYVIAV